MPNGQFEKGVAANRLPEGEYRRNFSDIHPPLSDHEALVAADRCYFCHDAPCIKACPTSIDIPLFIRQIMTGDPLGSAKTILDQNILGGLCGRVCPTESLCEQACVREAAEGKPVQIGLLQRHATDKAMGQNAQFYGRAPDTGRKVAVVGAGPAGLACAHRLSMRGNRVTVFDDREKPGGLNEYGVAPYKTVDGFAQAEIRYVTERMEIEVRNGMRLGDGLDWKSLRRDFDALFIGVGLTGTNPLGIGEDAPGQIGNATDFIARVRQAEDLASIPVGRRVVVIGGGMTAIDIATQSMLLGAEQATIAYRRGPDRMGATQRERAQAQAKGVAIRHWLRPLRAVTEDGRLAGVEFEHTSEQGGKLAGTGERIVIDADQAFQAVGQALVLDGAGGGGGGGPRLENGRILADAEGRTSVEMVWAGGDCVTGGDDLTVTAVAQGRDAAESIHRRLNGADTEEWPWQT